LPPEPSGQPQQVVAAIQEVTERAQVIVREEIELAKTEITEKVTKLVKGAVVGGAAAVFAILGLILLLHGFSWLAWYALPVGESAYFWGFFLVALILFLLGGLAGFLAYRFVKSGSPPTPEKAIAEAQLIRETVKPSDA